MKLFLQIIAGLILGVGVGFVEILYRKNVIALWLYAIKLWFYWKLAVVLQKWSDWGYTKLEKESKKPMPPLL